MTPEERFERIERQLEFLAAHQGELSVSLETLRDSVARHDVQIVQLTDVVVTLAHIVEEQGRRMDVGFARLTEAQLHADEQGRRTDERLNTLVNVVERYFSNGRKQTKKKGRHESPAAARTLRNHHILCFALTGQYGK